MNNRSIHLHYNPYTTKEIKETHDCIVIIILN